MQATQTITYLLQMLEAVDYKGFDADAAEDLVVVDHYILHSGQTLDF